MLDLTNKKINQSLSEFQQKFSFILISLEEEHTQIKNVLNKSTRKWKEINFDFNDYKKKQKQLSFESKNKFKELEVIADDAKNNLRYITDFRRKN